MRFSPYFSEHVIIQNRMLESNQNRILLGGFEPPSPAPKAGMIDHYTIGVFAIQYRSAQYFQIFESGVVFYFTRRNYQLYGSELYLAFPFFMGRCDIMNKNKIHISINISPSIHIGSISTDSESKRENVSRLSKMIFWRVLLPIIISHLDTYSLWRKVFYPHKAHYVC